MYDMRARFADGHVLQEYMEYEWTRVLLRYMD